MQSDFLMKLYGEYDDHYLHQWLIVRGTSFVP